MVLSRSLVSCAVLGAVALVGACTVNAGPGLGATQTPAGTTPIATSQARALVTGTVASSLMSGPVQMSVNDQPQTVDVAPDGTFEVRDVPTGDVKLGCQAGGVTGTAAISGVQPGEIIQVSITQPQQGGAIVIVVVQRTQATEPPAQVMQTDGDALVIQGSHVCYWLNPGHYKRDIVIKGDDVHLFGAAHRSCVLDDFTILDGKLELDGQGDTVLDVEVDGQLAVNGSRCAIQDSCTRCFDQDCEHACSGDDRKGRMCGPVQPSEEPDAGANPPDTEAQDCGVASEAGVQVDAAPSGDSAIAADGAGAEQQDAGTAQQDAGTVVIDAGGAGEASITPSRMRRR